MTIEMIAIAIGLVAQILFSLRLLIQWIKTEQASAVQSPTIFWTLSLIASFLLIIYGLLRKDIVIIGGQLLSYYIYIRNLQIKKSWKEIPSILRHVFIVSPFLIFGYLMYTHQINEVIDNNEIPRHLLVWGTMGQAIFTLRFIYQWFASERRKESVFPPSFWWISLVGSLIILSYGVFRKDIVLFIGQAFGIIIYIRNLAIYYKNHPQEIGH